MNFVEQIRVGQERPETGVRAEIDRPPFVFSPWKISRVGIPEDTPAEGDELFVPFGRWVYFGLLNHMNPAAVEGGLSVLLMCRLDFCNQYFVGADRQSTRLGGQYALGAGEKDPQLMVCDLFDIREVELQGLA